MKIVLIENEFCSRCHMIAPLLKDYTKNNWIDFIEVDINNASPEDLEWETMLPIIIWDWEHISYEDCLQKISN